MPIGSARGTARSSSLRRAPDTSRDPRPRVSEATAERSSRSWRGAVPRRRPLPERKISGLTEEPLRQREATWMRVLREVSIEPPNRSRRGSRRTRAGALEIPNRTAARSTQVGGRGERRFTRRSPLCRRGDRVRNRSRRLARSSGERDSEQPVSAAPESIEAEDWIHLMRSPTRRHESAEEALIRRVLASRPHACEHGVDRCRDSERGAPESSPETTRDAESRGRSSARLPLT